MTIELTHQPRPFHNFFRRMIRALPMLDQMLMRYLRGRRVRQAEQLMAVGDFFPESRTEILADYAFSTLRTHRAVMQILNLESVLRDVESNSIEGAIVETGTYTGGASAYMLRALQRLRKGKPPRQYWGFDSFEGMPAPSHKDGDHGSIWVTGKRMSEIKLTELGELVGHDTNKADYDQCLSYLHETGYPIQYINLVKGWFQHTLRSIREKIGPIAVLRMDGDFYDSTKVVFDELYDLVVDGGIIIIDDYGRFQGCRRATEEFLDSRSINAHLFYVENSIRYFVKQGKPNS